MKCADKEALQLKCTATLNAYQSAIHELALPIDPLTGTILFRPGKEQKVPELPFDPKTGLMKQSYLDAIALHRTYHIASSELSKHLSTHRC
jgi:hypothetical protein